MGGQRGRPRSEQARRAVLDAALTLCRRDSYQATTMKGIADLAGVGRQTVYRWWPTKSEVFLEAVIDLIDAQRAALPDTGDARRDVELFLADTFTGTPSVAREAVAGLMADAQQDPGFANRLQGRLLAPRRATLRELLARGGFTPPDLDLLVDVVFGTMWYRLLSRHAPVDGELATQLSRLLDALCPQFGMTGTSPPSTSRS
ncbi:MAG: TetR/AcrR family transcriptional regulator [Kutzneria sp.]|nr:TetR/AcrR family transcriptional regulator [Kutzneria sp.]MBV9847290.1 TetR/AcrR family transcriptional regulator [Kutzneria sp.]